MAIAALVLGIVAIIGIAGSLFIGSIAAILGMVSALIAVVLGIFSRTTGAGKAGLTMGALALVGTLAVVVLFKGRSERPAPTSIVTAAPAVMVPAAPHQ